MGPILSILKEGVSFFAVVISWVTINIIKAYYYFVRYGVPFLVKYIGLPMFLGGMVVSGGFALGILILLLGGSSFYYKFIKKTSMVPPLNLKTGKLMEKIK